MNMDYKKMSNSDLEKELQETESNFNEYLKILNEVYTNLSELSDKYNNIQKILNIRHGKQ
jgi:hypothetical protein